MNQRIHGFVSGQVQGVFFRAHTQEKAYVLGLTGWVRNLPDRRVEIVAEGQTEKLSSFLAWVRVGPPSARVEGVEVKWETPQGEEGFRILHG